MHNANASAKVINFETNPEILIFIQKRRLYTYGLAEKLVSIAHGGRLWILCTRHNNFVVARYLLMTKVRLQYARTIPTEIRTWCGSFCLSLLFFSAEFPFRLKQTEESA